MKTLRTLVILGVALGAVGCESSPPPAAADAAAVPVTLGNAGYAEVATNFDAGGVIRARSTAIIASRVLAPITAVHVRAGDRVRRGAALVTLDAREMNAARAGAGAALDSAIEASKAAEADIQSADAALRLARATYERIDTLVQKRSATPQELDQATAALRGAEAQLRAAQSRAAAAVAGQEAARASLDASTVAVTYSLLTAPFDGVITERRADPGSMAVPGAALLTLDEQSALQVEVQLDEARAVEVAPGDRVSVRTHDDAWTESTVLEIARVDPMSHGFLIKVAAPATPGLRSGQFGRVRFSGSARRTLTIPASALFRRGQLTFVFAVSDGRARLQPVTTGLVEPDRIEVLAGLRDGDQVVLNPPSSLSDGARISGAPDGDARGSGDRR